MSLNQKTQDIQAAAKEVIEIVDGKAVLPKGFVEQQFPEGITAESIKEHDNFAESLVAGISLAFGEKSVEAMKADSSLEQTTLSTKLNKDRIDLQLDRTKTFPDGKGGQITKSGHLTPKYRRQAGNAKSGQLALVRAEIADQAIAALQD